MERLHLNFGIPGDKKDKPGGVPRALAEVPTGVNNKPYPDDIKAELVKRASRYPGHALRDFVNNIATHVAGIQAKRKKEQGGK